MTTVLRVPRIDGEDGQYVLLYVEPTGSRPLDLKLVGTDGFSPYVSALKQTQIHSLRTKNAQCDDKEWENILSAILVTQIATENAANEIVSSVSENKSIVLTIRKNVEGITSRLGTITLKHDEEQEIDLFSWAGLLCQRSTTLRASLSAAEQQNQEQAKIVSALQEQSKELAAAKASHETELLSKFQLLLNSKKAKIRDQQRVMASADMHPDPPKGSSATPAKPASPTSKKTRARKAAEAFNEAEDGGDVEEMDVDESAKEESQDDEDERMRTPSGDEDEETADEDDGKEPVHVLRSTRRTTPSSQSLNSAADSSKKPGKGSIAASANKSKSGGDDNDLPPPPRRTLPFQEKRGSAKPKEAKMPLGTTNIATNDDTDSDEDDEL